MKREIVLFWVGAIGIALAASTVLYRYAAVPVSTLTASHSAQPMEQIPDLNLGAYGKVAVTDLVGYYIDHPPAPKGASPDASAEHHFGGC